MISIICVYNNQETLDDYLLKSLKIQTAPHELILIDNREGQFLSAAKALNQGGTKASGKYLMFTHQDVKFSSTDWLKNTEDILNKISNFGIAGVAGKRENERGVLTNIFHDNPPRLAGNTLLKVPTKVQTVDECLAIIPKSVFESLSFDEKTCDGWDLYIVDYCLSIRQRELNAYIIPVQIFHNSTGEIKKNFSYILRNFGSFPSSYYQTLTKLLAKHKKNYKVIFTTCGNWHTSYFKWIYRTANCLGDIFRYLTGKMIPKNS